MKISSRLAMHLTMVLLLTGSAWSCPYPVNVDLNPKIVCVGSQSEVSFDVMPGDPAFWVTGTSAEMKISPGANGVDWTISVDHLTVTWNTTGVFAVTNTVKIISTDGQVTATNQASASNTVYVVEVQAPLQYKIGTNAWTAMPEPLVVAKDTLVEFLAVKTPAAPSWPAGKPVWTGADGTGDQASNTFSTAGTNYVYAECGNTVTGLIFVITNYAIIPSCWYIALSNTVTATAWTVDGSGAALKTNSDWTIPEGNTKVQFMVGTNLMGGVTNADAVTLMGMASSTTTNDVRVHAYASGNTNLSDDEWFTVLKVESVDVHSSDTNTHKIVSNLGTHSNHFVCVKDTGDIILDATLAPDIPAAADAITWEADGATITSPAVGGDKTTAKLPSATSQKIPVRIKVGSSTCWSGSVWVVWSTINYSNTSGGVTLTRTPLGGGATRSDFATAWDFQAIITPTNLFDTSQDVPDLTGANINAVPNSAAPHAFDGAPFGDATYKFDISRQWRERDLSPTLSGSDLSWPMTPGTIGANLPSNDIIQVTSPTPGADHFPTNNVEGNDDGGNDDNPYNSDGQLSDHDQPSNLILDSAGSVGDTVETRSQFHEFVRAEIGGVWYRISDWGNWRFHMLARKVWVRGGPDGQPGQAGVDEDADGQADDTAGPFATPEANTTNGIDDDGDGVVDDDATHPAGMPEPYGSGDDDDKDNDNVQDAGEGHWIDNGSVTDSTNNGF